MVESLVAALLGGSIVGLLAKYAITRALAQLDNVSEKINLIDKRLTGIDIYVGEIISIRKILQTHDRKLVELDTKMRGMNGFHSKAGFATSDSE